MGKEVTHRGELDGESGETSSGSWTGKVARNVRNSATRGCPLCPSSSILYKTVIRPVLIIYGTDTRAPRQSEQNLIDRTEMRMLRWVVTGWNKEDSEHQE